MAKRKATITAPPAGDPFRTGDELTVTMQSDGLWTGRFKRPGSHDIAMSNSSLVAITMGAIHHAQNLSRDGYTMVTTPVRKGRKR